MRAGVAGACTVASAAITSDARRRPTRPRFTVSLGKGLRRAKAPALEAYPFDAALSPSSTSTGYASTFAREGFTVVARRIPARPIMRHDLKKVVTE